MITKLESNEVFVFGSNRAGRHGKGAALTALRKFGAKPGQGKGLMGQSYGIPTKDERLRVIPLEGIKVQVIRFLRFANENPNLRFLVTPIGCGLAGYKPKEIAPFFEGASENVVLPDCFIRVLEGAQ
jgi:hypothetical protein